MKKYSMETAVGIFVVVGLICIGYMTVKLGNVSLFGDKTYPLFARFTTVAGLRVGSAVEIYGIQVGSVTSLSIDYQNQMGIVGMKLNKNTIIYDDAMATVKTAGLIGDKYVKIDPGGGGEPLKAKGMITQTSVPADIEDLIGKYAFGDVKSESGKNKEAPAK
ncbi:MAG: outer membrane lipid asymmetry maintenance protein MlaD [Syntrophorhabdaceae bacterium]